jgi:ParB/RepB/Spo0J family partition protein
MPSIDPHQIIVNVRQRTALETADLEETIERLGQLQPIVCRQVNDTLVLVAGGRRLQACKNLNRPVDYILIDSLDDYSAKHAELEENIKRDNLPWVDRANAITDIDELYRSHYKRWSIESTASKLGLEPMSVFRNIKIIKFSLKHPETNVLNLSSLDQALTVADRFTHRHFAASIDEINRVGQKAFKPKPQVLDGDRDTSTSPTLDNDNPNNTSTPISFNEPLPRIDLDSFNTPDLDKHIDPIRTSDPIICTSFLDWAPTYDGPRFNFIHCDFPYGVNIAPGPGGGVWDSKGYENDPNIFFTLTDCLIANFDRIASYSCHVMFWFAAKWYRETYDKLQSLGLDIIIPPIIWHHSDNQGIAVWVKGIMEPKRVYDMAFIASRGERRLLRGGIPNLYGAPLVSHPIHPTQKPESMLGHFFSMLVDNTTTMLDPTCGSASALCAAETLGAKSILGLEYDPEYAKDALVKLNNQRTLKKLSKESKE